jgi:hypothetical protein
MRTTLDLDEALLRQAQEETGARTKTDVIELGLKARRRFEALRGVGPRLGPVGRRRP